MTYHRGMMGYLLCLAISFTASTAVAGTLLSENFDGLPLGPNVDEGLAGDAVFTATPPEGWSIDNSTLGTGGITEFSGWNFMNKDWWVSTTGGQQRGDFTKGQGTVAVADPDEWDDSGSRDGLFNSFMTTSAVDVTAFQGRDISLSFDSTWRPFANQTGVVEASFDGGAPQKILLFASDAASPDFKDDNSTNDNIQIDVAVPAGTTNLELTWGSPNAATTGFGPLTISTSSVSWAVRPTSTTTARSISRTFKSWPTTC